MTKVHRVLKFKQSNWMKNYIDFNTGKKWMLLMILKNIFFKLMINSVYGKAMENLRKRVNVRLVNNEKDFLKYTSRSTYITHKIFGIDYAVIHEIKLVLILKKPIFFGFTVLDLNKWKIYDFHYNFTKKILMFNCYLLTQTVSLMKFIQ